MKASLVLEDGTVFRGRAIGAPGRAFGEAVFTTSMTGYQEIVTDPSYTDQIVCFSAAMVGNYGVDDARAQSARPHVRAVVMREAGGRAWSEWLSRHGIVALCDVDTRSLVLHLRRAGAMRAAAVAGDASLREVLAAVRGQPPMAGRALAAKVSTREPFVYAPSGRVRVAVVDFGCKEGILRRLSAAGAAVTVLPHDADAATLASYDGVVLSNGPGDPEPLRDETTLVRELLGRVPVLGVCLGHQLLGLATGHRTFKLPFGHRGANHPVLERPTGRVLVTSQNHGFAVAPTEEREATHVSLYDGTVEGFDFPGLRARSLQFHPEASPGPHDAHALLDTWVEELAQAA